MRFTLKELLLLVGCFALGMGAFEVVSRRFNLVAIIAFCAFGSTAAAGAFVIILVAIVRYRLARGRNSQD